MRREVTVALGDRSYPVIVGRGVLAEVGQWLAGHGLAGKAAILTQEAPGRRFGGGLEARLAAAGLAPARIELPEGEDAKSLATAAALYERFIELGLDRWSPVLALGGGTVGDIAGFVAGTYMRGMPFVQVPTTFLAQVDSSIGGKVAVNHPRAKNLIGLFHQPRAVFCDTACLEGLPPREVRAGMAEVVRYAAIADADFFSWLEERQHLVLSGDEGALVEVVARCARIKGGIVARDETERVDLRALLNYGHTVGHAVETAAGYGVLRHGEAVAIGMAVEADLAVARGVCSREVAERQKALLKAVGLPVTLDGVSAETVGNCLKLDKKSRDGRLRIVLTEEIGRASVFEGITPAEVLSVLGGVSRAGTAT